MIADLKSFLDEKAAYYNHPRFITDDPIQIPHRFEGKEDIEISAFLTASLSWGNRKSIIQSASRLMSLLDGAPFDFILNHSKQDLKSLNTFVHRTFNGEDAKAFILGLRHMYTELDGLEHLFSMHKHEPDLQSAITEFKSRFFEIPHLQRTEKHVSDPARGSAAKRINMFLRWMVRENSSGVDFGLWKSLSPAQLSCPLDVHSGNVARKLGLLSRKQNDAKAVKELDSALRAMDPKDPVKYDFALFGLGVFEKF